jgi:hypothetical protein
MTFARSALGALLLLGALPAAAEVTLTNATTHRVRLKITSIAPQGHDLSLASYASAAPPKVRTAWGVEDKGVIHEPTFQGTYRDLEPRPTDTLILYLAPGGQAVFTPAKGSTGLAIVQQVDFLLSVHGPAEGTGRDLPVRYRAFAYGPSVSGEILHAKTPPEDPTADPAPLEVVAPTDRHPDYRIQEPRSATCVIL